jgi:hypothetical protein
LGEIYARTGKVPEASDAYDSAAKAYPTGAAGYYKNEAVIFSHPETSNSDAEAAAADKAITTDPTSGNRLLPQGTGIDPEGHHRPRHWQDDSASRLRGGLSEVPRSGPERPICQ